jgi:hypothetical protein
MANNDTSFRSDFITAIWQRISLISDTEDDLDDARRASAVNLLRALFAEYHYWLGRAIVAPGRSRCK